MITQEIKKQHQTSSFVSRLLDGVLGNNPLGHIPSTPATKHRSHPKLNHTYTKVEYTRWIEEVKQKYKKGDFIAVRSSPIIMNMAPTCVYVVEDIQELHYEAEMDIMTKTPKALYVQILGTSYPTWRCPEDFRPLAESEKPYVNLYLKQKE